MTTDASGLKIVCGGRVWAEAVRYVSTGGLVALPDQAKVAELIMQIVSRWNLRLPLNRVRILTQERVLEVAHCLGMFDVEYILSAIDFYGRQEWQRRNRAWKTFVNFMDPERLVEWIEKAFDAADRQAAAKAAPKVKQLTAGIGRPEAVAEETPEAKRQREFSGMLVAEQTRLMELAKKELAELRGQKAQLNMYVLIDQAMRIRAREAAKNGQTA
jgi:hypothetical protein